MSHALNAADFPLWGSRLIEASAGTGKTWTIAALYLRLVLGHGGEQAHPRPLMPPDILVMTFTRAATRELSDRIRARLVQAVQCFRGEAEPAENDSFLRELRDDHAPGPAREQAAWRLAMAAECMDDAAIYTIDAWSQRMLREHAFDSGNLFSETLEPDETQRQTEAAQDYWRQQCYPLRDEPLDAVLSVWPHVGALIADMRELLREQVPDAAGQGMLADCLERAQAGHRGRLQELAQGWAERAQQLEDWLDGQLATHKAQWNGARLKPAHYKAWLQALRDWSQAPDADLAQRLKTGSTRLIPSGLLDARKDSAAVQLPPQSEALEQLLAQLQQLPAVSTALRLHAAARVGQRLAHLKRQAGTFGFADMLHRLDGALSGDSGQTLRARILAQYPVALIDEFQDTSVLQYRLFDQIYRVADNDAHSALLLIGDPKQSIYGFRGADIHSYLQARRATQGRHYVLGTNFRSTQALVQAVNQWFEQAEERPGEAAFLFRTGAGEAGNPLPFAPVAAQGRDEVLRTRDGVMPAMTVAWAAASGEKGPQPLSSDAIRRLFAAHCAEQIVQWLADAQAGFAGVDGAFARLRPADIAILVRTGKEAAAVRRELQARAVASVYLSDQDSVFASDEAQDLLYWLHAVAAPLDSRAVRAGLATRLIGLSLAELAWLAADDEAFDQRSEQLRALHGVWQRQGVLAMLRQSLHRLELPARWLAEPGGERRLTNFLHLAELLQTASAQLEGEQALIRWLATQIETPGGLGDEQVVRLESDADLVKVVTVHKAKGLEYPVVCLPFAGSFRALERQRTPFLSRPAADGSGRELLLDYGAEDLAQADRERLREDLRLFYVALTRPRHALWMGLAPMKKGNGKACVNHRSAAGYLLGGDEERSAAGWLDCVRQLCARAPSMVWRELDAQAPARTRWQPPGQAVALHSLAPYTAAFDTQWGIGSFSALVRAMAAPSLPVLPVAGMRPADDERAMEADGEADPALALALAGLPRGGDGPGPAWHRFMRGPVVGNFVHDQFEWLAGENFALPLDGQGPLAERLTQRCERAGRGAQARDVVTWLTAAVHLPLAPLGVALSGLTELLPEMEFWLPAAQLPAARIDAICREFILPGQPRPALPQRALHGMLMGFADLVFCHAGRYWVLDYKTNHLGADGGAYDQAALAQAMLHHRYDVQAALYLLALHRLLRSRLGPAYRPGQQLGGALYYFLRGLDGPAQGVHVVPPDQGLLDALDALLGADMAAEQARETI